MENGGEHPLFSNCMQNDVSAPLLDQFPQIKQTYTTDVVNSNQTFIFSLRPWISKVVATILTGREQGPPDLKRAPQL